MTPDSFVASALRAAAEDWKDDPEGAEGRLATATARAEREGLGSGAERARMRARLGQLRVFLGRLDAALRVLYDTLEFADDPYVALQLGGALLWRGDEPALDEAEGHLARALMAARRERDGPLAIGALCGRGDVLLLRGRPGEAVETFGEALGISEFSRMDAPSVVPLAGLARAHAAWRAPAKAEGLARRSLERARRAGDEPGRARALAALGAALGDADLFEEAAAVAWEAPHRPLALHIRCDRFLLDPGGLDGATLLREVLAAGMAGDAARLRTGPGSVGPARA